MFSESYRNRKALKNTGEFTTQKLLDMAMAGKENPRSMELKIGTGMVRHVPESVLECAREHLHRTGNIEKVEKYLTHAFYIYRETVNRLICAPHVKVNGAYEWPLPAKFMWNSMPAVIVGGDYLSSGTRQDAVMISSVENGMVKTREITVGREEVSVREAIPMKDEAHKNFLYVIDDLGEVGFVVQDIWQSKSLIDYVNPLRRMVSEMARGQINRDEGRERMENIIEVLARPYERKVGRYLGWSESPDDILSLFMQ
jgi:hypothetical protein